MPENAAATRRAILVLAAVCLAACGGGADVGGEADAAAAASAAPPPAKVLAEGVSEEPKLRVEVLEIARAETEVLVATFRIVNPDPAKPAALAGRFADAAAPADTFSGLALLDESGRKRSWVMRDDGGRLLCAGGADEIPPGGRIEASCRFPAPSAEASRVALLVPGVPVFPDLPVKE